MATFNVDSLDFVDDESVEFGDEPDFDLRYDSGNTRLELEDRVNAVVSYFPQNRPGNVVDGRFADAVVDGKALADDGNLYDSVDSAVSAASSWVKVGPGYFNESVTIGTAGLTLSGSGWSTVIFEVVANANNVTLRDFESSGGGYTRVEITGDNGLIENVKLNSVQQSLKTNSSVGTVIYNCVTDTSVTPGRKGVIVGNKVDGAEVTVDGDDVVIANNKIVNSDGRGISDNYYSDGIYIANRIDNSNDEGILLNGHDNLVANNRITNSGAAHINDNGTGTLLDDNQTG